jgi:sulfite exporter TauE/SafE
MVVRGVRLIGADRRPGSELIALRRRRDPSRLASLVASALPRRALPLGIATSALPCGLLAGGWALAAASAHPVHGAFVMAAFSAATAPGLIGALLAGIGLGPLARRVPVRWQGAIWCALGVLLALRPLHVAVNGCCH